jgi:hypothetical protein
LVGDGPLRIDRARVIDFFEQRPVPLADPNLNFFSRSDVDYFDRAISIYWDKTGKETSDASHGAAWATRADGSPMPYEVGLSFRPAAERTPKATVLHVRRVKNGTPNTHPVQGDELRGLRRLQRESPSSPSCSSASGLTLHHGRLRPHDRARRGGRRP